MSKHYEYFIYIYINFCIHDTLVDINHYLPYLQIEKKPFKIPNLQSFKTKIRKINTSLIDAKAYRKEVQYYICYLTEYMESEKVPSTVCIRYWSVKIWVYVY